MNSFATPSAELQDATKNLISRDPKLRMDAMRQVIALFAHGENCLSVQPQVASISADDSPLFHRFANVLNEEYSNETGSVDPVVQGIQRDIERPNPFIKAFAVRQAGSMMSPAHAGKLIPVIIAGATSPEAYVRKAAALAIAKISEKCQRYMEPFGVAAVLQKLLMDSNPNVAANALCALIEINSARLTPLIVANVELVNHLLENIADAIEWSQVQILEFVGNFVPDKAEDAHVIIQKVETRLVQANPAVTMAAVRCCLQMNMVVNDPQFSSALFMKILPPMLTLLNNGKEIQYTVLKSISVILQKYRKMFGSQINLFLCTFDDPIYIKLEKLDIILTLTTHENIGKVLEELYSYSQQEDVEFVRKSIRAIGRLAVVFEQHARACVDCLVALIQSKIHYVVQECIVVSVNIFRRYPNQYENIITTICQSLSETLDDHRAKAAMVWILGEYSRMITNAAELIESLFLEDFLEESTDVQLAILTASVKFFLLNPEEAQDMLSRVLSFATIEVDNPDLNDRAYMYMCLLTECPERAPDIVLSDSNPPVLNLDLDILEPRLVATLVPLIGTLSVVYGKFPQEFVPSIRNRPIQKPQQREAPPAQENPCPLQLTYEAPPPAGEPPPSPRADEPAVPIPPHRAEEEEEEDRKIVMSEDSVGKSDGRAEVSGDESGERSVQAPVTRSASAPISPVNSLPGIPPTSGQPVVVSDAGKSDLVTVAVALDGTGDGEPKDARMPIALKTDLP
jgi:vesicle coat complex subunit